MTKSELLTSLNEKNQAWQALLAEIGPDRMDQPGVSGYWSMKDIIAHLADWQRWLLIRAQAAQRGEPEPTSPWSSQLQTDDEINAWIYETNRGRSVNEVLDESNQVFQEIVVLIASLPDDTKLDPYIKDDRVFLLVWFGDKYFPVGEFFDHFNDDHAPDVRAWLAQQAQS